MASGKTASLQPNHRLSPAPATACRWILLIATVWCLCWFVHAWRYWEDDAYIHLEFARNLAAGRGYSFNGMLVNGDTAPLWVLLLVAFHAVIPNWLLAGKVLTACGAVFTLSGTYYFARHLARSLDGAQTFAASMVLLLATNPYFCYWSFSGMETLTAIGVAFWGTLIAVRERPTRGSFLLGCLVAGVAPVLRPEMMAFSGLAGLLLLRQWFRFPGSPTSGKKVLLLLLALALFVFPVALWSAYALHAFGAVIPNTNAAKRAAPGQSVVRRLVVVYGLGFPIILAEIAGLALLAFLRPALLRRRPRAEDPLPVFSPAEWLFVVWAAVAAVFYVADHTYVQTRYIFVMAPGLMIALLAFNFRSLPRGIYRLSLILALIAAVTVSSVDTWFLIRNKSIGGQQMRHMAEYIRANLPPNAPVAAYAIGELAFVSQHPIIDIGGITRPGAIPYLFSGGDDLLRWARSQGAQYAISGNRPQPGAVPVYSVLRPIVGWSLKAHYYRQSGVTILWKLPESGSAPLLAPAPAVRSKK